jgi:hypothetical protein
MCEACSLCAHRVCAYVRGNVILETKLHCKLTLKGRSHAVHILWLLSKTKPVLP